jgi:NAD+ kinase
MDSPQDRDEFSTPPTTPLPPSLSRPKTEHRPSSLRLGSAAPADFLPNIELGSPEVNTPESAGNRGAPTPRVAATTTTTARGPRTAQLQAHHAAPPKSPYFVHSHFDRGVSLTDWLRTHGPSADRDGASTTVDIVNDRSGGAKEGEVFEGDEDDEDYSQTSLTKQLAETAVGVREMSKQLGEFPARFLSLLRLNRLS